MDFSHCELIPIKISDIAFVSVCAKLPKFLLCISSSNSALSHYPYQTFPSALQPFEEYRSLLQLIEAKIKSQDAKIACVSLNAWQFEDYEDAKVAIMEALLKALKDSKTVFESAGEKIKGLLARINYFKIGKDLLFKGAPYAIGAITGNPLPIAVNLSADLLTSTNISEKLQNFSDQYIKSADSESITENIRKFRDEFEKMLADVKSIDNLVVIIDDLDRCSPDRIIDTLEAIKLFLSVKKTTFIVAVDQRIIEYAVRTKYPQIEGFDRRGTVPP